MKEKIKAAQSRRDKLPKGSMEKRKASKTVSHLYERVPTDERTLPNN